MRAKKARVTLDELYQLANLYNTTPRKRQNILNELRQLINEYNMQKKNDYTKEIDKCTYSSAIFKIIKKNYYERVDIIKEASGYIHLKKENITFNFSNYYRRKQGQPQYDQLIRITKVLLWNCITRFRKTPTIKCYIYIGKEPLRIRQKRDELSWHDVDDLSNQILEFFNTYILPLHSTPFKGTYSYRVNSLIKNSLEQTPIYSEPISELMKFCVDMDRKKGNAICCRPANPDKFLNQLFSCIRLPQENFYNKTHKQLNSISRDIQKREFSIYCRRCGKRIGREKTEDSYCWECLQYERFTSK